MKRNELMRRSFVIVLAFVIVAAFMPLFGGYTNAASKKYKLVKKVVSDEYSFIDGKYYPRYVITITYNKKGDPARIKCDDYFSDGSLNDTNTLKNTFTYKKGKRYKCKSQLHDFEKETITYDKKGRPKKKTLKREAAYGFDRSTTTFSWTKNGYLKKTKVRAVDWDGSKSTNYTKMKITQRKNGQLKKAVLFFYGSDKKWEKTESFAYNKRGFVTKDKYGSGNPVEYAYAPYKKGLVTKVIETGIDEYGNPYKIRHTFTYTKRKAGSLRYAKMINNLLTGPFNEVFYGIHTWY